MLRLRRSRPDPRRPHRRDGRARRRRRPPRRREPRAGDRSRLARGGGAAQAPVRRLRAGGDEAGDAAGGSALARPGGNRAGTPAHDRRRLCRRRPAGPAVGAEAALAERARDGRVPRAARAHAAAGPPRPSLLRRQRVRGGARAGGRGRRRGRGGGDDLRARLRDPRRPRRRARRGRARRRSRRPAAAADRALAVLPRRAPDRGARAVALRGPRPDAGDGGVVHRRDGRLAADRASRARARSCSAASSPTRTR